LTHGKVLFQRKGVRQKVFVSVVSE